MENLRKTFLYFILLRSKFEVKSPFKLFPIFRQSILVHFCSSRFYLFGMEEGIQYIYTIYRVYRQYIEASSGLKTSAQGVIFGIRDLSQGHSQGSWLHTRQVCESLCCVSAPSPILQNYGYNLLLFYCCLPDSVSFTCLILVLPYCL